MLSSVSSIIKKHLLSLTAAGVALGAVLAVAPLTARADSPWLRRETVVTFPDQVAVPNRTLAAGTYVFELRDPVHSQTIVSIYDRSGKHLIDTELTVPAYRSIARKSSVVMAESSPSGAPAVREIFAADHHYGYEFVYQH